MNMMLARNSFVFLLIACQLMIGCVTSEYGVGTHTQDVYLFSKEKEMTMGHNLSREIAKEMTLSNSPEDIERVNRIGSKIAAVCDRQELSYYFYIIEKDDKGKTDEKNAFSIPGGYVYIFKALLDDLNDDELAFVLAHEVGHIVSRHSIKRMQAAMGYNLLLIASAATPNRDAEFTSGLSFALAQIISGFSQEDEFNADDLAVKYTKAINADPAAGFLVMDKLYKENKKEIRPLSYFRTHPWTAARVRNIKEALHMPLDVEDYLN